MDETMKEFLAEVEWARKKHPGPYMLRQWRHHLLSEWHEALAEEPGSAGMRRELMHVGVVGYRICWEYFTIEHKEWRDYFYDLCTDNASVLIRRLKLSHDQSIRLF